MNLFELQDQSEHLTVTDLKEIEAYLDALYAKNNIDFEFTRHFLDRVNDARNLKHITKDELKRMFGAAQAAYGAKISKAGPDFEAVIRDVSTKINSPFVLNWNRNTQQLELVAKTVMRKDAFRSPDPILPVKTETLEKKLTEFKIKMNRDLSRLEAYRDLGLLNPSYETVSEDIETMREVLETITIENYETEIKERLSEVSGGDEHNVFGLALNHMQRIMPDTKSIHNRIRTLADSHKNRT